MTDEGGLSNNQRVVQDVALTVLDNVIQFVKVFESEEKSLQIEAQVCYFHSKTHSIDFTSCNSSIHSCKRSEENRQERNCKDKSSIAGIFAIFFTNWKKLCDKIIDGYEIPFVFSAKELVEAASEVHKILIHILTALLPQVQLDLNLG